MHIREVWRASTHNLRALNNVDKVPCLYSRCAILLDNFYGIPADAAWDLTIYPSLG